MALSSEQLFDLAKTIIPGGVNSPVRAFHGVGGVPLFFKNGAGAYLTDVEGRNYIDYVGSWGPLILGHCHPRVVSAVTTVLQSGMSFGAPTELEILLAQKIKLLMPAIEKIRMVNSGTEATMTAVRLARGFTRKQYIIKFNGCYHGHSDGLLVKAGSGVLTLGIPSSAGILPSMIQHTLVAEYNNIEQVEKLFAQYPHDIAGVIVEPIAGNMNMVLPTKDFLRSLRKLCNEYNSLLIFDEVMTGFRVALGGAQELYEITPDLTTLGKVIGGGMPVGALGGRQEVMDALAPEGHVYQAGTLSGNPLAMAAGLATLSELEAPGFYASIAKHAEALIAALRTVASSLNIPFYGVSQGGMFGFLFTSQTKVNNLNDVSMSDEALFKRFYHGMLSEGVYLAPSMYEAGFISSAHTMQDIAATKNAAQAVLSSII